ncbi:hypothetical protein N431DRAFT_556971 [Stipitochalara longipes BDJ]|nr:hypothetical protein N431DRAFT_556971 [Stipitochalara longipes BDJ]
MASITVLIGTPPQSVDLFSGGLAVSNILSTSLCTTGSQECYASTAGLYNASQSSTPIHDPNGDVINSSFADHGFLTLQGNAENIADAMFVATIDPPSTLLRYQNFPMLVISEGQWTLPDGRNYTIEVGNLALGAPYINQSMTNGGTIFDGTLLSSLPTIEGHIPSNSFGMHIGSVGMSIPPSIYFGGYDQSRVLGNVTVQPHDMHSFPIDLLDIGIGFAYGSSPFSFTSKSGLLAQGNSSIGTAMQVIVEPTAPFLYLPKSTCDAITQYLPVHYNSSLGLYLWNWTSPTYYKVISSSSYLSFTFRLNASLTESMTINVPFSLLNLTLTPPLVSTRTLYFPCTPYDYGKSRDFPTLGRAFLQAAFIGVNWGLNDTTNGTWFLAQAPGPNTSSQAVVMSIGLNDNYITPSTNDWVDSWQDSWNYLGDPTDPTHGVSTGTAVGVIVGTLLLLIIMVAVVIFWAPASSRCGWRKRRAAKKVAGNDQAPWQRMEMYSEGKQIPGMRDESQRVEADSEPKSRFSELSPEPKSLGLMLDARQRPRELSS